MADKNVDIYCELGFLKKFYKDRTLLLKDDDLLNWLNYSKLLSKFSDKVIIDANEEQFNSYINDETSIGVGFQDLLIAHSENKCCLHCIPNERRTMEAQIEDGCEADYFKSKNHHFFMLDKKQIETKEMEEKHGLFFISSETYLSRANFLFSIGAIQINNLIQNWSFMNNYIHPCNSIVLIDKYIFNEKPETIEREINSLFEAILPSTLNMRDFNINIITIIPKDRTEEDPWLISREKELKKVIKDLRVYSINVNIHYKDIHNRRLVTNYCHFESGYGFVLTDTKRRNGTNIKKIPISSFSDEDRSCNHVLTTDVFKLL
jgi:hypothetical protein